MLNEKKSREIDIRFDTIPLKRNKEDDIWFPLNYSIDNNFINYTKLLEISDKKDITNTKHSHSFRSISTPRSEYMIRSDNNLIGKILLINTTKEKEIEIGRKYPYGKLKKGECIVHQSLIKNKNNKNWKFSIWLNHFIADTILEFYYPYFRSDKEDNLARLYEVKTYIQIECTVKEIISKTYNKLESQKENVIIMENEYFFEHLSNYLSEIEEYFPTYSSKIRNLNPNDYSKILAVNFPPNRISYYLERDADKLLETSVMFANSIVELGSELQRLSLSMPLVEAMFLIKFCTIFLNLILNVIIISLFTLSWILIYSLLAITVETNSLEFGILRLVGTTKWGWISLISIQCFLFSFPAFILAYFAHFYVVHLINISWTKLLETDWNLDISPQNILIALIINFWSPICAAILPIKSILRKNIATNLNRMISKTNGIKIEVISAEKQETENLVVFGVITFLYGAAIYYFLPLSLITTNWSMIGFIFLWILWGIILGLAILSLNIESLIQRGITYILLFFTKSFTKLLIWKNWTAHKLKNRKTTVILTLSVSVFILISVSLDMILQSIKVEYLLRHLSDIHIYSKDYNTTPSYLEHSIVELFDSEHLESFVYFSRPISDLARVNEYFHTISSSYTFKTRVVGVGAGYYNVTYKPGLKVAKVQKLTNTSFDSMSIIEKWYLSESKGKMGMSGRYTKWTGLDLDTDFKIVIEKEGYYINYISKSMFLVDFFPGWQMNSAIADHGTKSSIVNFQTLMNMYNSAALGLPNSGELPQFAEDCRDDLSYSTMPIDDIYLTINRKKDYKTSLKAALVVLNKEISKHIYIRLKEDLETNIRNITTIIINILNTISTVVFFFCFFNLAASITISIFDQRKEIAIMRAVGMKKINIIFVYVCEAIVLILSASVIGVLIGCLIGYTMKSQWIIFMNIWIDFEVRYISLIFIVLFSIIGGIICTVAPVMKLMSNTIAELVRDY